MTSIFLAMVIIFLLAALIMYGFKPYDYGGSVKRYKRAPKTEVSAASSSDTRWRSVKIRPGPSCCRQISEITGQIFLAQDAPSLPLDNCTNKTCKCRYLFLEDRRSGEDRRLALSRRFGGFIHSYESERREVTGRRYADMEA